jgi:hypothetical protein
MDRCREIKADGDRGRRDHPDEVLALDPDVEHPRLECHRDGQGRVDQRRRVLEDLGDVGQTRR